MKRVEIPKKILGLVFVLMPVVFAPVLVEQFEVVKLLLMWIGLGVTVWALDFRFPKRDWIGWGMLAMLGSAMISVYFSIYPRMSFWGNLVSPNGFVTTLGYVGIYFVAKKVLSDPVDGWKFLKLSLIGAIVPCLYAISQFIGWDFIHWKGQLGEYGVLRPNSTVGHPNFLGGYLAMCFLVLLSVKEGFFYKFRWVFGAVFGFVILATQSRGTWLALMAGVLALLWWKKQIKVKTLTIVGAVVGVIPVIAGLVSNHLIKPESMPFIWSLADRAAALYSLKGARWEYLMGALRIWNKFPIFGSGTDTFQLSFEHQRTAAYWIMEPGGAPHRAHNEVLNVLATQGIVGIVALGLLVWAVVRQCEKLKRDNGYHALLVALLVTFAVQSLSSLTVAITGFFIAVVLALVSGVTTVVDREVRLTRASFILSGIVLFLISIVAVRGTRSSFYAAQATLLKVGYPEIALIKSIEAVKFSPGNDEYALLTAQCAALMFLKTKDAKYLELAIRGFQKAAQLNPAQALYRYFLGIALNQAGKPELAKVQFDIAMILEPNNVIYAKRGMR